MSLQVCPNCQKLGCTWHTDDDDRTFGSAENVIFRLKRTRVGNPDVGIVRVLRQSRGFLMIVTGIFGVLLVTVELTA